MPPQEITDIYGGYIGLDNIPDQLIGMEMVFDQGERRQATGTIPYFCVEFFSQVVMHAIDLVEPRSLQK